MGKLNAAALLLLPLILFVRPCVITTIEWACAYFVVCVKKVEAAVVADLIQINLDQFPSEKQVAVYMLRPTKLSEVGSWSVSHSVSQSVSQY